jgi:hypothetical protein
MAVREVTEGLKALYPAARRVPAQKAGHPGGGRAATLSMKKDKEVGELWRKHLARDEKHHIVFSNRI